MTKRIQKYDVQYIILFQPLKIVILINPPNSDSFVVLGHIAQSVMCLTADTIMSDCRSRGPILSWRLIDHEIIFTAILLPSADSRRVVISYNLVKVCAQSTG